MLSPEVMPVRATFYVPFSSLPDTDVVEADETAAEPGLDFDQLDEQAESTATAPPSGSDQIVPTRPYGSTSTSTSLALVLTTLGTTKQPGRVESGGTRSSVTGFSCFVFRHV